MLEGFLIGLLIWVGPAVLVWLVAGPVKLGSRLIHHH